jgi:hypothetical protein
MNRKVVTVIFVDKTRQEMNVISAIKLCRDSTLAGYVMDVETTDKDLQNSLRNLIDKC